MKKNMSELCLSSSYTTNTSPQFSSLSTDYLFFFALRSLSPSLLLILHLVFPFLSPLLIKTTLLCIVLLIIYPSLRVSILLSKYYPVVERLRLQSDNESKDRCCLEDFKVFKMVFLGHPFEFLDCKSAEESESPVLVETPAEFLDCKSAEESESPILVETPVEFLDCKSAEESESSILESSCYDHNGSSTAICDHDQYLRDKLGENSAEMGSTRITMERKKLEDFLKELDVFENMAWSGTVEEKKTEPKGKKIHKAKDWKRTLACKFFEERHNASDSTGEEMDLLWEKYEMDSIKNNEKRNNSNSKKKMRSYVKEEHINEHIEQLCCLEALNLSAGKKNLAMGRANFVRISKEIKGFKWLYHVSKNNKKVHCGDRF